MIQDIELLKQAGLQVIGLGVHDTSDEAIKYFSDSFGSVYRLVEVGREITITTEDRH